MAAGAECPAATLCPLRVAPMPLVLTPLPLVLNPLPFGDAGPLSVDLAGILPERVRGLRPAEVAALAILADGRRCEVGDLFAVAGDATDAVIECRGDFSRVHRVAAGMRSGTVRVAGNVGRHAGEALAGGRLEVRGNAGDWLAAEIAGGEVMVAGDAGHNVAGGLPGSSLGGTGGLVVVGGSVGKLAASRLRRGVVAVAGDCGAGGGFEMHAGTLVIGGRIGGQPGLGMRRGSVVALTDRPLPPATFRAGRAWRPAFLPLLFQWLARAGFGPAAAAGAVAAWRQWHGDALAGGRGELLHPA